MHIYIPSIEEDKTSAKDHRTLILIILISVTLISVFSAQLIKVKVYELAE